MYIILMLRYAVGSASTTNREQGFLDAIKEKYPDIKVLSSDQYAGATRELAYTVSQNLLSRYNTEVNGIFCPNESVTVSMTKALRDLGKAKGKVKVVGFDTSVVPCRLYCIISKRLQPHSSGWTFHFSKFDNSSED